MTRKEYDRKRKLIFERIKKAPSSKHVQKALKDYDILMFHFYGPDTGSPKLYPDISGKKSRRLATCHGEEPTPNDEDCYIQHDRRGGYSVSCGGNYLNSFSDFNDALTAINVWMKKNSFYPNVWIVDDHGGAVCIDGKGKEISGGSSTISKRKKGKSESATTAPNTGSPKLRPCDCVRESIASKYLEIGYKYCHWCGRQLRASA